MHYLYFFNKATIVLNEIEQTDLQMNILVTKKTVNM